MKNLHFLERIVPTVAEAGGHVVGTHQGLGMLLVKSILNALYVDSLDNIRTEDNYDLFWITGPDVLTVGRDEERDVEWVSIIDPSDPCIFLAHSGVYKGSPNTETEGETAIAWEYSPNRGGHFSGGVHANVAGAGDTVTVRGCWTPEFLARVQAAWDELSAGGFHSGSCTLDKK